MGGGIITEGAGVHTSTMGGLLLRRGQAFIELPPLPLIRLVAYEVPEWKSKAMGKAVTYGIKDARSIKDQRENLPIFKLKQQLIAAVHDNQVRGGGGGRSRISVRTYPSSS